MGYTSTRDCANVIAYAHFRNTIFTHVGNQQETYSLYGVCLTFFVLRILWIADSMECRNQKFKYFSNISKSGNLKIWKNLPYSKSWNFDFGKSFFLIFFIFLFFIFLNFFPSTLKFAKKKFSKFYGRAKKKFLKLGESPCDSEAIPHLFSSFYGIEKIKKIKTFLKIKISYAC